jgi:hypothetical protein
VEILHQLPKFDPMIDLEQEAVIIDDEEVMSLSGGDKKPAVVNRMLSLWGLVRIFSLAISELGCELRDFLLALCLELGAKCDCQPGLHVAHLLGQKIELVILRVWSGWGKRTLAGL